jgi:xylitol oxidase
MRPLAAQIEPILHVSEIRTIAADRLWMSPAYERDSVAIHFTWHREPERVLALLPEIEATLAPFDPRPHWGKLFAADAATLTPRYPRAADFKALADRRDPRGAFRNPWLERHVFGADDS